MGAEWEHVVFGADLDRAGDKSLATALDGLLREFALVDDVRDVLVLDANSSGPAPSLESAFAQGARNVRVSYKFHASEAIGEQLHGETSSRHADDYYAQIRFVVGDDYRTFAAGEQADTLVTTPALVDGSELVAFEPFGPFGWPAYDASTGCSAPVGRFRVGPWDPDPGDFTGIWRSALFLDFGRSMPEWTQLSGIDRDLPGTADLPAYDLPDSGFMRELIGLFGGSVHHFGAVH